LTEFLRKVFSQKAILISNCFKRSWVEIDSFKWIFWLKWEKSKVWAKSRSETIIGRLEDQKNEGLKMDSRTFINYRTTLQNPEIEFAKLSQKHLEQPRNFMKINSMMILLIFRDKVFKNQKIQRKIVFILFRRFIRLEEFHLHQNQFCQQTTILFKNKTEFFCNFMKFISNQETKNHKIWRWKKFQYESIKFYIHSFLSKSHMIYN
jgi:hypothetical protein